jgi:hypothetical protein
MNIQEAAKTAIEEVAITRATTSRPATSAKELQRARDYHPATGVSVSSVFSVTIDQLTPEELSDIFQLLKREYVEAL